MRARAAGACAQLSRRSFTALGSAALAACACPHPAEAGAALAATTAITVRGKSIAAFEPRDPQRRVFGALTFRGGLELTSAEPNFGGLSSIRLDAEGTRFLAVTDRGDWLRGRILYEGQAPVAIADAEMAPILGPDGRPFRSRRWYDAESLAQDGDAVFVGFERVHGIARFSVGKDGLLARGQPIAVPPRLKQLSSNKGIESLVVVPRDLPLAGALIALSERGIAGADNSVGFLIGGPTPGEFVYKHHDDYDVTDAAVTADGDLLVLERYFSIFGGLGARIRRVPLADIKPDVTITGSLLWQADMGHQIDNMEGLAVHRDEAGAAVLTLVSDDNLSSLQRTLLLQFTLGGA